MAPKEYGFVDYRFKRNDGSGEELSCPMSWAAFIRANRLISSGAADEGDRFFLIALFSAEDEGLLGRMDVDFDGCDTDDDRMLRLFSRYHAREVQKDDDGNEDDGGGDTGPTRKRRPASRS